MDRGAWWAIIHEITKESDSTERLEHTHTHTHTHIYTHTHTGGPQVKHPLCNGSDAGSIPGQGTNTPHTTGQLSPSPQIESMHHNKRSHMP